jgi:hypothetical protein
MKSTKQKRIGRSRTNSSHSQIIGGSACRDIGSPIAPSHLDHHSVCTPLLTPVTFASLSTAPNSLLNKTFLLRRQQKRPFCSSEPRSNPAPMQSTFRAKSTNITIEPTPFSLLQVDSVRTELFKCAFSSPKADD